MYFFLKQIYIGFYVLGTTLRTRITGVNKTDQKEIKEKAYNGVYILFQWTEFGNKIVGKYRLVISAITKET